MEQIKSVYTLLLTVIFIFCLQFSASADQNGFYFIQITDTHWGQDENVGRTKSIIDSINNLPMPIEFIAHTGDLTYKTIEDQPFIDSVLVIMRTCKYPVFYLPGNHDISFKHFRKTSQAFIRNFGSLSRRIEVRDVSIITLFNFEIHDSEGKSMYDPLEQLDSLLKGKPAKMPAIIFQHDPTTEDFYDNAFHPGWPSEDRVKFQKLCETNNVIAIIAGHFHRDEFHWLGQIPLYVSPPIAGKGGRRPTFRVYHYENGKISYFTPYQ